VIVKIWYNSKLAFYKILLEGNIMKKRTYELNLMKLSADLSTLTLDELIEKSEQGLINKAEMIRVLKIINSGVKVKDSTQEEVLDDLLNTHPDLQRFLNSPEVFDALPWMDNEKVLGEFSIKYPNWLFELTYKDEKETWKKFFSNGRMQISYGKIVYEDFNPNVLQVVPCLSHAK
jgi:hypothetical protein